MALINLPESEIERHCKTLSGHQGPATELVLKVALACRTKEGKVRQLPGCRHPGYPSCAAHSQDHPALGPNWQQKEPESWKNVERRCKGCTTRPP